MNYNSPELTRWLRELPIKTIKQTIEEKNDYATLEIPDELTFEVADKCFSDEINLNEFSDSCELALLEIKTDESLSSVSFEITLDSSDRRVLAEVPDDVKDKFLSVYKKEDINKPVISKEKFLFVYKRMLPGFDIKENDDRLILKGFKASVSVSGHEKEYALIMEIKVSVTTLVDRINNAYKKIYEKYGDCSVREAITQGFIDCGLEAQFDSLGKLVDEHYPNLYEFGNACMNHIVKSYEYGNIVELSYESNYSDKETGSKDVKAEDIEEDEEMEK